MMIEILYQDNRIAVCLKPPGILSTDEPGGLPSLLREQFGDPKACVRTVHRLDQVVGGVMVLARSRAAASILSGKIEQRSFRKEYLAVVHGALDEAEGTYRDLLARDRKERRTYITDVPGKDVREAVLDYRVLASDHDLTLVSIVLHTGRTHQIRAQFSGHGHPLYGDAKYGAPETLENRIALWSHALTFPHPQTEEMLTFRAVPPALEPWERFSDTLNKLEVSD